MTVVPVHMGSPRFTVREQDGFRAIEAWFPPGEVLARHVHARPVFAVMLAGSFEDHMARRVHDCVPASVFVEPAGEPHENRIGRAGAHVLVIQPDPERTELVRPVKDLLDRIHHFRDGEIADLARRAGRAMRVPDDDSAALDVESLALEALARAARRDPEADDGAAPAWLERARERIHDTFREAPTVAEIAADAGVHRVHLARAFRARYHVPIGTYIRRLRLEWSAARLLAGEESISSIALRSGFSDQPHFTRAFRKHLGLPPGEYRRVRADAPATDRQDAGADVSVP